MSRRAIFIDRDGTLCEEVSYLDHLSRLHVFPYSVDAVRLINQSDWLAVLVTNQAGVAHGYFPETFVEEVHAVLRARMADGGSHLDGIYYCPHHPSARHAPYRKDCDCRKPRPGLLLRAAADLGIDLTRSCVVGDRRHDVELGWAVGGRGVLVRTGHGRGELLHHGASWPRPPDFVAENLLEAVGWILDESS